MRKIHTFIRAVSRHNTDSNQLRITDKLAAT